MKALSGTSSSSPLLHSAGLGWAGLVHADSFHYCLFVWEVARSTRPFPCWGVSGVKHFFPFLSFHLAGLGWHERGWAALGWPLLHWAGPCCPGLGWAAMREGWAALGWIGLGCP